MAPARASLDVCAKLLKEVLRMMILIVCRCRRRHRVAGELHRTALNRWLWTVSWRDDDVVVAG